MPDLIPAPTVVPTGPPLTMESIRTLVADELAKTKLDEKVGEMVRTIVTEVRKDDAQRFGALMDATGNGRAPVGGSGSGVRVVNRGIHRYAKMYRESPESMAYRFPEADIASAEWIRAMAGYGGTGPVPAGALAAQKRMLEIFGEEVCRSYYCGDRRSAEGVDGMPRWEGSGGIRANLLEGTTTAGSGLSPGSGGPLIPLPLELSLISALNKAAKIRMFCPVYNSVSKTLRIPSRGAATVSMQLEGAVAAQGEPAFVGNLFDKKKMSALFGVSKETLLDSAFDLVSILSTAAGAAMGELEDLQACQNGNGTAPNFSANLTTGVTDFAEASSTVLTYVDLVNFWYQLPEQYQSDAVWFVAANVAPFLSRLIITGGMGPVLVPKTGPFVTVGDLGNVQGTIFGRPVIINQLANGALWIGRPDLAYGLLETPGIIFESSIHAGWATDTVQYKFTRRIDGQSLLVASARTMTGIASIA